ncbi:hypothetical protein BO85DRAFT_495449 [Aspergillus piperis CBS 112811]|uniref:Tat pathway signal sequence n=1 Tax=Aspergillus piperis CBS 112811 TaxID=1448313 RepID=A0A8G1RCV2_9EURO|nr:hypothetical protein BO85DRAFT_495449 [Aspergillus piperis CBS 112811]RAH63528.1 hypothetical protein BO85DRAFT_495449 [Aspergillus piperis CBS 112811]
MDSITSHENDLPDNVIDDDSGPLLDKGNHQRLGRLHCWAIPWLLTSQILVFLLSFYMLISGLRLRQSYPTDQQCAAQLSAYSPFIDLVEYDNVRFQGSLFDTNPYKGAPNPRLDDEWKRITHMAQLKIAKEDMPHLKKPLSQVKVLEAEGDGYAGGIEVFHQLHCVNLVRQYTYYGYYSKLDNKPVEFSDSNETLRLHVDHCIDMLRQVIQCNGDVGVVTRSWVKGRQINYPDFSVWHKCRRLEPIMEYAKANEIESEPVRSPDALELSQPPCTNAPPDEICP